MSNQNKNDLKPFPDLCMFPDCESDAKYMSGKYFMCSNHKGFKGRLSEARPDTPAQSGLGEPKKEFDDTFKLSNVVKSGIEKDKSGETPAQKTHESPVGDLLERLTEIYIKPNEGLTFSEELPPPDDYILAFDVINTLHNLQSALQAQAAQSKRDAAEIERLRKAVEQSIIVTDDMHETNAGSAHGFNLKCSYQKQARQALSHKEEW